MSKDTPAQPNAIANTSTMAKAPPTIAKSLRIISSLFRRHFPGCQDMTHQAIRTILIGQQFWKEY